MNRRLKLLLLMIATTAASPVVGLDAADQKAAFIAQMQQATEEEAYAIGLEAYLYGYPRVELARRIYNETNRVRNEQVIFAPLNKFFYFDRLARPGDGKVIKAPNNDTLYGSAYLDLSSAPVVLRVPQMKDRQYIALIVDAAGNVANRLSTAVSGAGGVDHVFVGPNFTGAIPEGARAIRMDGNHAWLLMRVTSNGKPADEKEAARLLKQFQLAPLGRTSEISTAGGANAIVSEQPVIEPLAPIGNLGFYPVLAKMLQSDPVPVRDQGMVARWERIGFRDGQFDAENLSPPVKKGLERAIASGEKIVAAAQFGIAINVNGWNYSDKIGRVTTDWALNAAIARGGYGNVPEDSVYYQRNLDSLGTPLSGQTAYTLKFKAGAFPPVKSFWSITAYDQKSFDLIENPIKRYSLGDRTEGLRVADDGSLTIAIQRDRPSDPALRANWLPVGDGPFYLIIRTYDPKPQILEGVWAPPEVEPQTNR